MTIQHYKLGNVNNLVKWLFGTETAGRVKTYQFMFSVTLNVTNHLSYSCFLSL